MARVQGARVGTHEVVTAVADGEVVQFLEGDASLTFANVAGYGIVYRAICNEQGTLLALALTIDFDTDDGEHQSFVAARVGGEHLLEFGISVDAHIVMLTHAGGSRCGHIDPQTQPNKRLRQAQRHFKSPPATACNACWIKRQRASRSGGGGSGGGRRRRNKREGRGGARPLFENALFEPEISLLWGPDDGRVDKFISEEEGAMFRG